MAVSSEATVIIDVEVTSQEARQQADALGASIQRLKDANSELAKQNKRTSTSYVENQQNIQRITREQKQYIQIANGAAGSQNQLRAQLSLLTSQYNALSREERDNTVAGKALTVQINAIRDEVSKTEQSIGDFRRNVGNYTDGINKSVVGQVPFLNQLSLIKDAFGALQGVATGVKEAIAAQTVATELNTAALEAEAVAAVANERATEANTASIAANTAAQRQAVIAEQLRAEADAQRLTIEAQLVVAEEREAAILTQLAAEEAAVVAEEQLRIVNEQALLATQTELVAAEEARVAAEAEVAASTAAVAASTQAAAAKTSVWASGLSIAKTALIAVVVAAGAAVVSFARQFDSVSDTFDQRLSALKDNFNFVGQTIVRAFTGEGLGAFKNFFSEMDKSANITERFTEAFQNLEDLQQVNELQNQAAQNEVNNLRIRARNRSLDFAQRKQLLDQADKIENDAFLKTKSLHETIIAEQIDFAGRKNKANEQLTADEKKQLQQGNIQLLNNLLNADRITKEGYEKLRESYGKRNQDIANANNQLEKIQNDQDKYAEKEKAAQEKRQAELDKINEDRIKSQLLTSERLFTEREKEIGAINPDIDKRIKLYRKYGQDTEQLEYERQVRIGELNTKFHQQDLVTIRQNLNEAQQLRISLITDNAQKAFEASQLQNQNATEQVDRDIAGLAGRIALGEQGLTDVINSALEKRNALIQQGDFQRQAYAEQLQDRLHDIEQAGFAQQYQDQLDQYQREYDLVQQRIQTNEQLTQSYGDLVGAIGGLTDKQTALGKIAFLAQKAFAIQQIILNAELTKSQIILRYEILKTQATLAASLAGPFAPLVAGAAIAGLTAAQGVEIAKATAQEVVQVGIVAATALAGVIGKEKGGVQYSSDGKGAILPGYSKKDNMNARLRDGEAVIVSEAARDPYTRQVLSDINVAYGGRAFANGGVYGGSYIQSSSANIASQVYQNNLTKEYISSLKIYTAVTDINTAQGKYAKITDAGNF